jgi:hypothetical protein
VLGQSGGAERRHHLVKFQLKPVVYREVRCDREFTTSASKAKKKKKKKKLADRTSKGVALQQQGVERRQSVCNYAVGAVK